MQIVTATYASDHKGRSLQLVHATHTAWLGLCVPILHPLRIAAKKIKQQVEAGEGRGPKTDSHFSSALQQTACGQLQFHK